MRQGSQISREASDDGRRAGVGSTDPSHQRRRILPLSIRTSLVIVLLVPLVTVVGLASTLVVHQLSTRHHAVSARQSSLTLDALLRARVDLYAEYIPSEAVVVARGYKVSPATLNSLLGVNVQAELIHSRRVVDQQAAFGPEGAFRTQYAQLVRLRHAIDAATASPTEVATLFNGFGAQIEDRWQDTLNSLSYTNASSDSATTKSRLAALGLSFDAFTSGLGEENLKGGGSLETLLTATATPAQVQNLIVSHQQFETATASFPGALGPHGAAAWKSLTGARPTREFAGYVQTGIAVGLGHLAPPIATSSNAIGGIARIEVAWADSLTKLVLASSVDLRTATADQASAATHTLVLTCILTFLLVVLVVGAVVVFSRQVRRPLDDIVAAATSVREGRARHPCTRRVRAQGAGAGRGGVQRHGLHAPGRAGASHRALRRRARRTGSDAPVARTNGRCAPDRAQPTASISSGRGSRARSAAGSGRRVIRSPGS